MTEQWHKVASLDDVPEGRVTTRTVGTATLAVTHVDGKYGVLDNRCPHQGGPLGEGTIEKGWLRCPWHGYDYSPLDGQPPEGFSDAPACFATEVREDGVYALIDADPPRPRTVSDVLVETMIAWGVTHVFGMVGHSNLGFADAMRVAEERGDLTYVGIRHEGAASFAASAYGKLTGGLAACFGIAGPGSTNLLTGLYDAKQDRAPILAISGQVPSSVAGRGAFQDLDLEAAFADVAAWSTTIRHGSDHAELMTLACKNAIVGRDVAHLVLPDELQHAAVSDDVAAGSPDGRLAPLGIRPPEQAVDAALELLAGSARPVIVIGHGARSAVPDILALAEILGAAVLTTFKAKGVVADDHPLAAGVLGRSGTPVASWMMNECDAVVVFGASFSNHTGIAEYKPLIQVDSDRMALGRFHPVNVPVQGDAAVTAQILAGCLAGAPVNIDRPDQREDIAERRGLWRQEKASRRADDHGLGVNAAAVFDALSQCVPDNAVLCVDVGNNAYSFGRYFESRGSQSVLMSGYLGSIGFALPAAMGAWAAVGSERPVISVSGDGGLGQYLADFTTLVKYRMPIVHVVLVNGELGKISKEQRAGEWPVWQTDLVNPSFAAFAELCGGVGIRVESVEGITPALERAVSSNGPVIVEIMQDSDLL